MKKFFKSFTLFVLPALLTLSGCSLFGGIKLPKPVGSKVDLTATQLANLMNNVRFDGITSGYATTKASVKLEMSDDVDSVKQDIKQTVTENLADDELWLDSTFKITENLGVIEGRLVGYDNGRTAYFELKHKNNEMFDYDDANELAFYDGKYRALRSENIYNRLDFISYVVSGVQPLSIYDGEEYFFDDAFEELARLRYKGISFYRNDSHFSIQLDIKTADFRTESEDIVDVLEYIIADRDLIERGNFKLVFVFERNRCINFGVQADMKLVLDDLSQEQKLTMSGDYKAKQPKIGDYSSYNKIADITEILK